jgi:hypothetical protein
MCMYGPLPVYAQALFLQWLGVSLTPSLPLGTLLLPWAACSPTTSHALCSSLRWNYWVRWPYSSVSLCRYWLMGAWGASPSSHLS